MRRFLYTVTVFSLVLMVSLVSTGRTVAQTANKQATATNTYSNPLPIQIPGDGLVESCADPTLIKGQQTGDSAWYMYCTTDPLNDEDRNATGDFNFRRIPMFSSQDLVNWTYRGDAFSTANLPTWAVPSAGIWAPEIQFANNQYYLYYVVTDVTDATSGEPNCGGDSAIGVATSASPLGPWTAHGSPVIAPRRNGPGCNFFWTFDPDVLTATNNQKYIYYGSYYGGVWVQQLDPTGFIATNPVQVTIANRYEGAELTYYNGFYYLFVSATNCCNGPLTGYSVFVGRSSSPTGPFVDREGVSLLAGQVGGTPFINLNGNRWVGAGHNSMFTDLAGQWWTVYHAVDQNDPYFADAVGFTKRPVLLDPVDWIDGWPTVRGGLWASDSPQPAPVAQPGDTASYTPVRLVEPRLGNLIPAFSDEFNTLDRKWSWVREPAATDYAVANGVFRLNTSATDLYVDNNSAPVLVRNAPGGNYVVETKFTLNLPAEGCCFNYVQAGLVIYDDDDNYIKHVYVSIWETRQTEFAKEESPVQAGFPRYGNTVGGPPNLTTWLRIGKETRDGQEYYTAYTSRDGVTWVRGGTWTHELGSDAKIGLVAFGGSGFEASFDYVRVYRWQQAR